MLEIYQDHNNIEDGHQRRAPSPPQQQIESVEDDGFDYASPTTSTTTTRPRSLSSSVNRNTRKTPGRQNKKVSFAGSGNGNGGNTHHHSKNNNNKTPNKKKLSTSAATKSLLTPSGAKTSTATTPTVRTPLRSIRNFESPAPTTRRQQSSSSSSGPPATTTTNTPTSSTVFFSTPALSGDNQDSTTMNSRRQHYQQRTNTPNTNLASAAALAQTPNSASAFRRSLRSTLPSMQQQQQPHPQSKLRPLDEDDNNAKINSAKSVSELSKTFASLQSLQPQKQQQTQRLLTKDISKGSKDKVHKSNLMASSNTKATTTTTNGIVKNRSRLGSFGQTQKSSSNTGVSGPPRRHVAPNTPTTLLRYEMDAYEQNESLLLTPPPGCAGWHSSSIPDSAEGIDIETIDGDAADATTADPAYNELQTGLVVLSPQVAMELQKEFQSSSASTKEAAVTTTAQSSSVMKETTSMFSTTIPRSNDNNKGVRMASTSTPSPTLPRAILKTPIEDAPKPVTMNTTNNHKVDTTTSSTDESPEVAVVVESKSRTEEKKALPSTSSSSLLGKDKSTFNAADEDESALFGSSSKPLSSSLPVYLMSRLAENRKTESKKESGTAKSSTRKKGLSVRNSNIASDTVTSQKSNTTNTEITTKFSAKNQLRKKQAIISDAKESISEVEIVKRDEISQKKKPTVITNEISKIQAEGGKSDEKTNSRTESLAETTVTPTNTNRGGLAFEISFAEEAHQKERPSIHPKMKKNTVRSTTQTNFSVGTTLEDWGDHQSQSFVAWLNYTFHPEEEEQQRESDLQVSKNGGNETCTNISGLRSLVLHRRLAQGRDRAKDLFKSEKMRLIREAIVLDIAKGRLSIRADRDITADLQLRKQLTSLLLSYTTPWLRLGLEVMFSEFIEPIPFNSELPKTYLARMKQSLELFIQRRLLSDEATLAKFTKGKCTLPSGKFEKKYKDVMRSLVLSRIMVLIFFLDHAKMENALDKVPRLFTLSSEVKSSRDVIVAVCRACLHAEGDVTKHLARIGLRVSYQQLPVDEVNFHVKNLASELRDGVLLTRLAEIVSETPVKSLMSLLRLPAVSRLQKKYNVNLAMSKLQQYGIVIPDGINAHHIMDGHREVVLALMWCIISHFCMTRLLESEIVEYEIKKVIRSTQARQKMRDRTILFRVAKIDHVPSKSMLSPTKSEESPERMLRRLLLGWGQAVCSAFGITVNDFSSSFADGKAICLLVHYYHPSLVRLDDIFFAEDITNDDELTRNNEQRRWLKASKALHELGGIPNMLPRCDSMHPPDEKAVLLSLSYLFSRLTESSNEILAAILIQACYRKYRHRVLLQKKIVAAGFISRYWVLHRENYFRNQQRRYAAAVAKLEEFVIKHKQSLRRLRNERLEREHRHRSAIMIQKLFRGGLGRELAYDVFQRHQAALTLQCFVRSCSARGSLCTMRREYNAARSIQKIYRGFLIHRNYQSAISSIVKLQRVMRGCLVRQDRKRQVRAALVIQQRWWKFVEITTLKWAATKVQSAWRGTIARQQYYQLLLERDAACFIQTNWRMFIQRTKYLISIESIILMQKVARGFNARKKLPFRRYQRAATLIQKVWRGFSAQVRFQIEHMDVVCVQSVVRRHLACKSVQRRVCAIATLQGAMRCSIARKTYSEKIRAKEFAIRQHNAAIRCQCAVRCWMARSELNLHRTQRLAATAIQKSWRGFSQYRVYVSTIQAASIIQSYTRRMLVKTMITRKQNAASVIQRSWKRYEWLQLENDAAVLLQSVWRSHTARADYLRIVQASCVIQKSWRGYITRLDINGLNFAAVQIQSCWRRFWAQQNFTLDVLEIIIAQSVVRRFLARKKCLLLDATAKAHHAGAVIIQSKWRSFVQYIKYKTCVADVTIVQSSIRRYLAKRATCQKREAVIKIQSHARMFLSKMKYSHEIQLRTDCATCIQSIVRAYLSRLSYEIDLGNTIKCQSIARRFLAVRKKQSVVRLRNQSATAIQTLVRGHAARKSFRRASAARCIQKTWRCWRTHIDYLVTVLAIVNMQHRVRTKIAQKTFLKKREAVIKLQTVCRQYLVRKQIVVQHAAATMIQAAYRMHFQSDEFFFVRQAALIVQGFARGILCRKEIRRQDEAATNIQRMWRGYVSSSVYLLVYLGVLKAQSMVRMKIVRRRYTVLTFQRSHSVRLIQRAYRRYVLREQMERAACLFQRCFREYAEKKRIALVWHGVLQFQSVVRGALVRKRRSKRLVEVARRLVVETKKALRYPNLRLGARTHRALEIIRHSESLTKIMEAVKELEASTRLSYVCCEVFTRAGASEDLLRLIQSCNRSVPHMELKEHILLTLENIGHHEDLVLSLATSKYCEVFMDNIQVFRDKDGIFCLAVSLLDRITSSDIALSQFCGTHERLKQLREVYRVVARKKVDQRQSQRLKVKRKKFQYGRKKRVIYDRDLSTKVLGNMILSFADNSQAYPTANHDQKPKQHFTFD